MTRIALLHGYSSHNSGDGVLVEHSLDLIRDAFGENAHVTLFAMYPDSFQGLGVELLSTRPRWRGWSTEYLRHIIHGFSHFDIVVAVGGGYLRAGNCKEFLKTCAIAFPQLYSAARSGRAIYLPQSVGPFMPGTRALFLLPLRRVAGVYLRDDRSMEQLPRVRGVRAPDLAIQYMARSEKDARGDLGRPVFNVRFVSGTVPRPVLELTSQFQVFDGLVQSTVAGNEDSVAVGQLGAKNIVNRSEFYSGDLSPRVVVAMRLHAALQALNAGHYVVHLAYERKGYGAFNDLGLPGYVHSCTTLDVDKVLQQVRELQSNASVRGEYDFSIARASGPANAWREAIANELQRVAKRGAEAN